MSIRDLIFIGIFLFSVAIGIFFSHFINVSVSEKLLQVDVISENEGASQVLESLPETSARMDTLIFVLYIGLIILMFLTSYFTSGHPIFMFIHIMLIIFSVIVGVFVSNTWESIVTNEAFGVTIASFPLTNNIFTYLPFYNAVTGVLAIIMMFLAPMIKDGRQEY